MRFVFWQNALSIHQSAHIRALAQQCEVTLVTQESLSPSRKAMGWTIPSFGRARLVCGASDSDIRDIVSDHSTKESVHIFSGISSYPVVHRAFRLALGTEALIGLLSEAPPRSGVSGLVRFARAAIQSLRYRNRIAFVLAIGGMGVTWYRDIGYPIDKIHSYAYFVEPPEDDCADSQASPEVRLIFVGRCIHTKGIDLLLTGLRTLADLSWQLEIVGDGPDRQKLEQLCHDLGLDNRVSFVGNLPNNEAMEKVAAADLLVLPSRFDGWGAVVSEALMRGTPVVCSDRCGSAVLLGDASRGEVLHAGSVEDLRNALARAIRSGGKTPAQARRISEWSKAIGGQAAADYLLQIVSSVGGNGPRPVPPWQV